MPFAKSFTPGSLQIYVHDVLAISHWRKLRHQLRREPRPYEAAVTLHHTVARPGIWEHHGLGVGGNCGPSLRESADPRGAG
jgi:hypothetical protein